MVGLKRQHPNVLDLDLASYRVTNPEFCRRAPPAGACIFWTQKSNQGALERCEDYLQNCLGRILI